MRETMRVTQAVCLSIIFSASLTGHADAADEARGDLDVTIRVIDSKQGIDEFINRIELPRGYAETAPAAPARSKEAASNASAQDGEAEGDTPRKRRDTGENPDERRDNGSHKRKDNSQTNPRLDSAAPDQSWMSEHKRRDSADLTQRSIESRERHENMQSHSREQRESAREKSRISMDGVGD
jgi:hypothetical protein